MKLAIKVETTNETELYTYLKNNFNFEDFHPAVIALITDKAGNILLQRRGPKSRDDSNRLADIGGAVEKTDKTFIDSLYREIHEEVGTEANISVDNFVGGVLKRKYDSRTKTEKNWLFLFYKCTYEGGELKRNEEGKSLGYEFYKKNKLPRDEMLETSKYFWDYYNNSFNKCYSYAMGIGDRIKNLDSSKFDIVEDDGDYEIIFDKRDELEYKKFIINNLEVGYWNEYFIDDKVVFYFRESEKEIRRYILSEDNNEEVLVKCREYAESDFVSVRQMFIDTPFYNKHLDGMVFYD